MILTPATKTTLRLLVEGDLHPIDFNVWAHPSEKEKPANNRHVSATMVRKLLAAGLVESNETGGVRMTDKGQQAYETLPEFRRSQAKETRAPTAKKRRPRGEGFAVYEFTHDDKTQTFGVESKAREQIRTIQAKAWEKDPDGVPTITLKVKKVGVITKANVIKVLRDGLGVITRDDAEIEYAPVTRPGYYRHYLQAKKSAST